VKDIARIEIIIIHYFLIDLPMVDS